MDGIKIKNFHRKDSDKEYVEITKDYVSLLVETGLYELRKSGRLTELGRITEILYLLLSAGF